MGLSHKEGGLESKGTHRPMKSDTPLIQPKQIGRKFSSRGVFVVTLCFLCTGVYGQGQLPICDKKIPTSQWSNCVGVSIGRSGARIYGEFKNGKPEGKVSAQFLETDSLRRKTYVGEVLNERFHGWGILTFSDGRPPEEGIWDKSVLIREGRVPNEILGWSKEPKAGWNFRGLLEK